MSGLQVLRRPSGRFGFGSAHADTKVYIAGGETLHTGKVFEDFWAYDTSSSTWSQLPDCPLPHPERVSLAAHAGYVYAIDLVTDWEHDEGETRQHATAMYSIVAAEWEILALGVDQPQFIADEHSLAVVGDVIYAWPSHMMKLPVGTTDPWTEVPKLAIPKSLPNQCTPPPAAIGRFLLTTQVTSTMQPRVVSSDGTLSVHSHVVSLRKYDSSDGTVCTLSTDLTIPKTVGSNLRARACLPCAHPLC